MAICKCAELVSRMVTDGFIVDHVDQLLADQCLHIHIDDIGLHLAKKMLIVKKMISKFNKLAISSVHCTSVQ